MITPLDNLYFLGSKYLKVAFGYLNLDLDSKSIDLILNSMWLDVISIFKSKDFKV